MKIFHFLGAFLQKKWAEPAGDSSDRQALVKKRPARLVSTYEVLDRDEVAEEMFQRLRRQVFAAVAHHNDSAHATVFTEHGKMENSRRTYFYVKPQNESGWLFERSTTGWVVSRAEKIVDRDLFLRRQEAWDIVTLFDRELKDERGRRPSTRSMPRVKSANAGEQMISFTVYEQRLLQGLGLHGDVLRE